MAAWRLVKKRATTRASLDHSEINGDEHERKSGFVAAIKFAIILSDCHGLLPNYSHPMSDDQITWVDCAKWRERWEVVDNLPSGGQGEAFRARRKIDGRIAFLKVIKLKADPERRARFFREASAYDTFSVSNIPVLIESNAHRHKEESIEPYIATEFINGRTLRKWREKQTRVALADAVATIRSLLATLRECHAAGCVHRDVKPDNIILVDADPARATLLDFGLNFHEMPGVSFQTEHWQEIGNRFLRLPELSAGSFLKQDPRSDLSFVAGILFYMLTGEHPDLLQDAEGRLPHQRSQALAFLHDVGGVRYARLASLFDNSFAPRIGDRFTNANAMLASIDRMMEEHQVGRSAEDDLKAILEVVDTAAERRRVETTKRLSEALQEVRRIHDEVEKTMGGALSLTQSGFGVTGEVGTNTLSWKRPGSNGSVMSTTYEAREAGDEIIIRMSGKTVFRTPIALPGYGEEFQQAVRTWLLARIRAAISDPHALPPKPIISVSPSHSRCSPTQSRRLAEPGVRSSRLCMIRPRRSEAGCNTVSATFSKTEKRGRRSPPPLWLRWCPYRRCPQDQTPSRDSRWNRRAGAPSTPTSCYSKRQLSMPTRRKGRRPRLTSRGDTELREPPYLVRDLDALLERATLNGGNSVDVEMRKCRSGRMSAIGSSSAIANGHLEHHPAPVWRRSTHERPSLQ
jgi:hypothetical protein